MAQEAAKEKAEALAKLDPNPQIEQLGYDKLIWVALNYTGWRQASLGNTLNKCGIL